MHSLINCDKNIYIFIYVTILIGWRWKCSGAKGFEDADPDYVTSSLSELMRQLQEQKRGSDVKVLSKAICVLAEEMY